MRTETLLADKNMDVLRDLLDNLNDSVVITDASGHILMFNREAMRIQKSISDKPIQVGSLLTDIVAGERTHTLTDILKTLKRQKKPLKNFTEYKTPFGTSVFLEVSFVPVLGPRRELRYIHIISQDITSRKLFEKRVRATAADFHNLLQQAHAVIFSIDSRGYIVDWNDFCVNLTGFTRREILSQQVNGLLISEANAELFTCLMDRVLRNEPVGNCELPMCTRDGGEVIVMLSATPRTNANGHVIGATMVGQDITELTQHRRMLETQIRNKTAELEKVRKMEKEAVEMKSRFVSIASHEFRSPLSSIDYAASFIKQNAATIGKRKLNEKVKVIEKHVHYMSHLIDDVLTYSRNEAGKIQLMPSTICLETFIKGAVEEVMCLCKHSHHVCVSTNNLGELVTDEKMLRSILINLLTNAVKFSPGKEEVSLNVLDEGHAITLEVSDEGIGIPPDEIKKIFEPFVRGKAADSIQGTGLGLSIVKKAVDLLNGRLSVKSRPGKGSVFKVVIPRKDCY